SDHADRLAALDFERDVLQRGKDGVPRTAGDHLDETIDRSRIELVDLRQLGRADGNGHRLAIVRSKTRVAGRSPPPDESESICGRCQWRAGRWRPSGAPTILTCLCSVIEPPTVLVMVSSTSNVPPPRNLCTKFCELVASAGLPSPKSHVNV